MFSSSDCKSSSSTSPSSSSSSSTTTTTRSSNSLQVGLVGALVAAGVTAAYKWFQSSRQHRHSNTNTDTDNDNDTVKFIDGKNNCLLANAPLRHQYVLVRHGESEANVAKLISSEPNLACVQHGLTKTGFEQAHKAALSLQQVEFSNHQHTPPTKPILLVTSDFKRARETAQTFQSVLRINSSHYVESRALRERSFGDFEGKHSQHYHDVWKHDAINADHTQFHVESVNSVVRRTTNLIESIEHKYETHSIVVLFAHGDVLQILQTAFQLIDPRKHRSLPHLNNCELRTVTLNTIDQ
jgi:broad specificity phosphatase PhoE